MTGKRPLGRVDEFVLSFIDSNGPISLDEITAEIEASANELGIDGLIDERDDHECSLVITDAGMDALRTRWKEGS